MSDLSSPELRVVLTNLAEVEKYLRRIKAEGAPIIAFDAEQGLFCLNCARRELELPGKGIRAA